MEQETERLYPSATLLGSDQDLKQRSEKKLTDVSSFNNSINKNKEMYTYFKNGNINQKRIEKK